MKKFKALILFLTVALVLSGCSGGGEKPTDDGQGETQPKAQIKREIEVYGKVDNGVIHQISLSKAVKVQEVFVKKGQRVKKGDPLFSIDIEELKSELNLLKFQVESIEQQINLGNPSYSKATINVKQTRDKLAQAQKNLNSNRALYAANAISKKTLDDSAQAVRDLQNTLKSAQYDVTSTLQSDKQTNTNKKVELEQAKNKLSLLEKLINSPQIEGENIVCALDQATVSEINVNNGAYLNAYSKAATLIDQSVIIVNANIVEDQIKNIKLGQKVIVKPLMDKDLKIEGEITFMSAQAAFINNETVVPVEITCKDASILLPNLNVDVTIPLEDKKEEATTAAEETTVAEETTEVETTK